MAVYTTIDNPELYFQTVLWTGDDNARDITLGGSENMQPDLIWSKKRSNAHHAEIVDSVRGVQKFLIPSGTDAEYTDTDSQDEFQADGFGIAGADRNWNEGGHTFVAWCWKESATAGFDIVTYTGNGTAGNTASHSLSAAPSVVIVKKRSDTAQWAVGHKAMDSGFDYFMFLDADSAKGNADNVFNDTAPSSSVITLGNAGDTNANTETYVAYCFAPKQGFSKFGKYSGNGNANGTFVYTGFRPAFIITKRTDSAGSWGMFDNKRSPFNVVDDRQNADLAEADQEHADNSHDFLSNGFKVRTSDNQYNNSSGTYVFMAFAEQPFVNSNGVPCTAR